MSVHDMNGSAGEGPGAPPGKTGGGEDTLKDVFGYLRNNGSNGIAINGILAWIDIQQKSTPENIWMAQAESHFADHEIDVARSALWKAASNRKDLIGAMVAHKSPGKAHKNLVDIAKAMKILKEKKMLPMLISTSDMMKKCPAFHVEKDDTNAVDIMARAKVLEESMNSFMKQQGEQMRNIVDTIGTVQGVASSNRLQVLRNNETSSRNRSASPAKRPRVDDNHDITEDTVVTRHVPSYSSVVMNSPANTRKQASSTRLRRNSTLVFGEAKTGKDDTFELLAADANLVASGVSKDATCEQLKQFLEFKGVNVTEIELISNAPERRTNTFRVAIKAADYDKAMQPEVWPYRVGVRRFIPKRPRNDWASQSANSGGNIQLESAGNHSRGQHSRDGGHSHRHSHQGVHHYQQDNRVIQFATSAPSNEQFYLPTQNRFNGLQDNVNN